MEEGNAPLNVLRKEGDPENMKGTHVVSFEVYSF